MTKFTNPITIDANGKDVVFDGIDFTLEAKVVVKNAKSVTIKNCRVYNIGTGNKKQYWLNIMGDIATKLTVERNFFGKNTAIYNLMELTCKLEDGSSISSNYFVDGSCSHNYIGMYGAKDNVVININKNFFETSKEGGIRIGAKGAAICTLNVNNNKIEAKTNQESEEWEGLLCLQPYGKSTADMSGITIHMNHNEIPSEQKVYGYSGNNDTLLTEDNCPVVIIDKVKSKYPIVH